MSRRSTVRSLAGSPSPRFRLTVAGAAPGSSTSTRSPGLSTNWVPVLPSVSVDCTWCRPLIGAGALKPGNNDTVPLVPPPLRLKLSPASP